jgi:PPIC-type PPIASE domain
MTARSRLLGSLTALACAAVGLAACGGTHTNRTVVRVGRLSISAAAVEHWTSVLARGHVVRDTPHYRDLKRQALAFLIETDWLIGEASDRSAGGPSHALLDRELQTAKELAATKIRMRLEATAPKVTAAEIELYYKQHIKEFAQREQRRFYIEEDLTSRDAALRRKRELERGSAGMTKGAATLYESLPRPADMRRASPNAKAIFSARRGEIVGPSLEKQVYYLMQVTRISPAHTQTLAEVRDTIKGGLETAHWQQALARFARTWRRKWTSRTNCTHGYVVQKCRQYRGVRAPEDPTAFS